MGNENNDDNKPDDSIDNDNDNGNRNDDDNDNDRRHDKDNDADKYNDRVLLMQSSVFGRPLKRFAHFHTCENLNNIVSF